MCLHFLLLRSRTDAVAAVANDKPSCDSSKVQVHLGKPMNLSCRSMDDYKAATLKSTPSVDDDFSLAVSAPILPSYTV